jgi:hypothetical protein
MTICAERDVPIAGQLEPAAMTTMKVIASNRFTASVLLGKMD